MKEQVEIKKNKIFSAFSTCDKVLMYTDRVVMPLSLQKRILKEFHSPKLTFLGSDYIYIKQVILSNSCGQLHQMA